MNYRMTPREAVEVRKLREKLDLMVERGEAMVRQNNQDLLKKQAKLNKISKKPQAQSIRKINSIFADVFRNAKRNFAQYEKELNEIQYSPPSWASRKRIAAGAYKMLMEKATETATDTTTGIVAQLITTGDEKYKAGDYMGAYDLYNEAIKACGDNKKDRSRGEKDRSRKRKISPPRAKPAATDHHVDSHRRWTWDEEQILTEAYGRLGNRWEEISVMLPHRSASAIQQHWAYLERKKTQKQHRRPPVHRPRRRGRSRSPSH